MISFTPLCVSSRDRELYNFSTILSSSFRTRPDTRLSSMGGQNYGPNLGHVRKLGYRMVEGEQQHHQDIGEEGEERIVNQTLAAEMMVIINRLNNRTK